MNESVDSSSSLFPAYATTVNKNDSEEKNQEWLHNPSFSTKAYEFFLQTSSNIGGDISSSQSSSESDSDVPHPKIVKEPGKQKPVVKTPESTLIQESTFLKHHLKKAIFLEDTGLSDERAFKIDKKYDAQNLAFGSVDPKIVPLYRCVPTYPLGSSKKEIEMYYESKKKKKQKRTPRYFGKKFLRSLEALGELCVPAKENSELRLLPEYLSFPSSTKGIVEASGMPSFDGVSMSWKSHSTKSTLFSDASSTPGNNSEGIDIELQEKVIYFNRAVTESVHDEKLWLDFVDFQRELYQSSRYSSGGSFNEKLLTEKQVAILERALKHNPNSVKLSVAKLKLLRTLTEKEELFPKWENFLFYFPHDSSVWQQYLDFVLTDVTYFCVSFISKLYKKCLNTLRRVLDGELKSHSPPPRLSFNILDVFSNICGILLCCGHQEISFSIFQATLEFTLDPPKFISSIEAIADQRDLFEPFWDSGAPRIGESNSLGWSKTVTEKKIMVNLEVSVIDLSNAEDQILLKKLSKSKTWLEFEVLRESNHFLPWRPDLESGQTNDDLDDPDRIVNFDQISGFLIKVRGEKEQFYLLCQFLKFLGVKIHYFCCSEYAGSQVLEFCRVDSFDPVLELMSNNFPGNEVPEAIRLKTYMDRETYSKFIDNLFQQVMDKYNDEFKTYASFIWLKHKIDEACKNSNHIKRPSLFPVLKKFAKNMLKRPENRNCLFLWSEYIHIEWLSSGREKAAQTFEALLMSSTAAAASSCNDSDWWSLWYFVRKFIELVITHKENMNHASSNMIVWLLSHVLGRQKYSIFKNNEIVYPSSLVKAFSECKKSLKTLQDVENDATCNCIYPLSKPLLDCVFCASYLNYFVKGFDAAMTQFTDVLKELNQKIDNKQPSKDIRFMQEQITVYQAELLDFHLSTTNKPLKPLQSFLYGAIEEYPSNVQLLHIMLKIKSSVAVVGPTRRFFCQLIKSGKKLSVITWLFAIISELMICCRHMEPLALSNSQTPFLGSGLPKNHGLLWKIRALFDSAVKHPGCEYHIALWRTYLKFEVENGDSSKAKSVLYQALQVCPWSKALYLDGIGYFPEEFDHLMSVMNEKELRIHTPPEEIDLLMEHALNVGEHDEPITSDV